MGLSAAKFVEMGCPWLFSESMEDKRRLPCRRSLSWYGARLCLLKETAEGTQVREERAQQTVWS